jgi:hypothetical protein
MRLDAAGPAVAANGDSGAHRSAGARAFLLGSRQALTPNHSPALIWTEIAALQEFFEKAR